VTFIGDDVWMLKHSHVVMTALFIVSYYLMPVLKLEDIHCEVQMYLGLNAVIHQKQDIPSDAYWMVQ